MNMLMFLSLKSLILIKGVTSIEVSENEKVILGKRLKIQTILQSYGAK
jgi:hypothetical protein